MPSDRKRNVVIGFFCVCYITATIAVIEITINSEKEKYRLSDSTIANVTDAAGSSSFSHNCTTFPLFTILEFLSLNENIQTALHLKRNITFTVDDNTLIHVRHGHMFITERGKQLFVVDRNKTQHNNQLNLETRPLSRADYRKLRAEFSSCIP